VIDVLIQTFNEELNLPHTLKSVTGWVNNIFVVDSGSTDSTQSIAEGAGGKFVYHAWEGYAAQKNWALENLPFESEWVLILDADEAVSAELRDEIIALAKRPVEDVKEFGFYLNRIFVFCGRRIRHCGYFPSYNLRLFRRGKARYEKRLVHEHMLVDGPTGYLKGLLVHEDRRGLEHFFAKHNRYSTLEAREIFSNPEPWPGFVQFYNDRIVRRRFGKSRILPKLPGPWFWRFAYMYLVRGGFLDGKPGRQLCGFISSYEFSVQLKYRELLRLQGKTPPVIKGLSKVEGEDKQDSTRAMSNHTSGQSPGDSTPALPVVGASEAEIAAMTPHQRALYDKALHAHGRSSGDPEKFVTSWTFKQNIGRVLWMLVRSTLFRPSFHNWYGYRRFILRTFGAKIGRDVRIRPSVKIEIPWNLDIGDESIIGDDAILYSLGQITIGRRVVVSQYAHLCAGTHDYRYRSFPLVKPPITIGDEAWVAADAFVGPGVFIGDRAILGARSSAFRDIRPGMIAGGNPAREIRPRDSLITIESDAQTGE